MEKGNAYIIAVKDERGEFVSPSALLKGSPAYPELSDKKKLRGDASALLDKIEQCSLQLSTAVSLVSVMEAAYEGDKTEYPPEDVTEQALWSLKEYLRLIEADLMRGI